MNVAEPHTRPQGWASPSPTTRILITSTRSLSDYRVISATSSRGKFPICYEWPSRNVALRCVIYLQVLLDALRLKRTMPGSGRLASCLTVQVRRINWAREPNAVDQTFESPSGLTEEGGGWTIEAAWPLSDQQYRGRNEPPGRTIKSWSGGEAQFALDVSSCTGVRADVRQDVRRWLSTRRVTSGSVVGMPFDGLCGACPEPRNRWRRR